MSVMPWKESSSLDQRVKFVAAMLEGGESFVELCERFGISRKPGYKWKERYEGGGVEALAERSRAPHSHPHAVSSDVVQLLVNARKAHPTWGPRKLLAILKRHHPNAKLPAASTVGELLTKRGMVGRRKRVRRNELYRSELRSYEAPNRVWCADFKGHFGVGDQRCHPLTITDGFSRYLLCCKAQARPLSAPTQRNFEITFREYGLPDAIRTDNGAPFFDAGSGRPVAPCRLLDPPGNSAGAHHAWEAGPEWAA
ncbi:MAG TPA: helix-turn-helix domain-containing protein [Polyangiaceae bacterium]